MNKTELIAAVSAKTELTKKDAAAVVSATIDTITEALASGDKVQLLGVGTFEVRERAARMGVNPSTREQIEIPATKQPIFKPGKVLKEQIQ